MLWIQIKYDLKMAGVAGMFRTGQVFRGVPFTESEQHAAQLQRRLCCQAFPDRNSSNPSCKSTHFWCFQVDSNAAAVPVFSAQSSEQTAAKFQPSAVGTWCLHKIQPADLHTNSHSPIPFPSYYTPQSHDPKYVVSYVSFLTSTMIFLGS